MRLLTGGIMFELILGDGKTGVHPGKFGDDNAIVFTTLGTGVVGEKQRIRKLEN